MVLHLTQIKKGMGSNICLTSILPVYVTVESLLPCLTSILPVYVTVESLLPCLTAVLLYVHHNVYYLSRQYHCISREKDWYMLNSITVCHGRRTDTCLTALLYVTGEGLLPWLTWLHDCMFWKKICYPEEQHYCMTRTVCYSAEQLWCMS
jgi:hypothetical protein